MGIQTKAEIEALRARIKSANAELEAFRERTELVIEEFRVIKEDLRAEEDERAKLSSRAAGQL